MDLGKRPKDQHIGSDNIQPSETETAYVRLNFQKNGALLVEFRENRCLKPWMAM